MDLGTKIILWGSLRQTTAFTFRLWSGKVGVCREGRTRLTGTAVVRPILFLSHFVFCNTAILRFCSLGQESESLDGLAFLFCTATPSQPRPAS